MDTHQTQKQRAEINPYIPRILYGVPIWDTALDLEKNQFVDAVHISM